MTTDADNGDAWLCREVVLLNSCIHCRPAALIVKTAGPFEAEIVLSAPESLMVDGKIIQSDKWMSVSAKSVMGVMLLGEALFGEKIRIEARGPDAEEALAELEALFRTGFYEE